MRKVFLSSRWDDTFHASERIYKCLLDALRGERNRVFKEVHHPQYGHLIEEKINAALDETEVLLAVIGPKWLSEFKRREVALEQDWVRFEIESSLERKIPAIPIYVDGAKMPKLTELPESMRAFFNREGKVLPEHDNFDIVLNDFVRELMKMYPRLTEKAGVTGPAKAVDTGKKRGKWALGLVIVVWGLLFWYLEVRNPGQADPVELSKLLNETSWVSYDPSQMYISGKTPIYPDLAAIERDLDIISEAGFTGVVTSGANGVMAEVPRLAHQRGLRVIMGIWEPGNRSELTCAIRRQEFVSAYCVGHDDADPYLLARVQNAIRHIKRRTGLPATTTEKTVKFNDELAQMGDWLFPDVHVPIRDTPASVYSVDIRRDIAVFRKQVGIMADFAQKWRRPLLLKNVAYPHAGIEGASETAQKEFFEQLVESLRDPVTGVSVSTPIVVQGAFDAPWKTDVTDQEFHAWDPFSGVISINEAKKNGSAVRFRPVVHFLRNDSPPQE